MNAIKATIKTIGLRAPTEHQFGLLIRVVAHLYVCMPIMAYAAKVWMPDLRFEYQRKALRRLRRRTLIATTGCYGRVSVGGPGH